MYQPETLEVPQELMVKFTTEANSVAETIKPTDIENFINGYVASCIATYKRNNGVPSIPFPISLSTVDMICIANTKEGIQVMLGRKPGQPKWQFPGGFRDPKETSRSAAARELGEEACLSIEQTRLEFIGELFVDDIRYRNTPHKITTQIFLCRMPEEEMVLSKPGDDLGEINWFLLEELIKDNSCIRDIHLPIFDILVAKLNFEKVMKEVVF